MGKWKIGSCVSGISLRQLGHKSCTLQIRLVPTHSHIRSQTWKAIKVKLYSDWAWRHFATYIANSTHTIKNKRVEEKKTISRSAAMVLSDLECELLTLTTSSNCLNVCGQTITVLSCIERQTCICKCASVLMWTNVKQVWADDMLSGTAARS